MTATLEQAPRTGASVAASWLRALELTASIARNPNRLLSTVVEEQAARFENKPALLSDRECFTYRELCSRMHQYAHWALEQSLQPGDVVCLLMPNRPEYLAIWLGLASVGCVAALLNTNLTGAQLAHSIRAVMPRHIIVCATLEGTLASALVDNPAIATVWTHGVGSLLSRRIDEDLLRYPGEAPVAQDRRPVTIRNRALYVFTSGTTGMPKAASVSHARILQWSHWFAGMMHVSDTDRMYNCLPMYHSVGGVQAPGAILAGGGSVVFREKFSASQFWSEIFRHECTVFQYIGELCRYLLHAAPSPAEARHRVRLACGNGLAADVWERFQARFHIPQILEFYASTEGGVSLFNVEGKPGALGRTPGYLAHRFAPALIQVDLQTGAPVRTEEGLCLRCQANEPGEAIGKLQQDESGIGTEFEGYADREASERKILRSVFQPGDAWVRTGDLMRKDEAGFYRFIDRLGDTFRWKGENVSTLEVAEVLCAFAPITHAVVYGVQVPRTDGRVGMATLSAKGKIDLPALREHLMLNLPVYARPRFLRVRQLVDVTGTFKYARSELVRQGYDPDVCPDQLFFDDAATFVSLDRALHRRIREGEVRF